MVLKHGELFLLTDESGDIPWELPHGLGLFFRDCRFLDGYTADIDGEAFTVLSADDTQGYKTSHHLTNPELPMPDSGVVVRGNTVGVRRDRRENRESPSA